MFSLAWNFQSRLKFSISTLRIPHKKLGGWWVARLKISISLENFKVLNFFKIFGSLGLRSWDFTHNSLIGVVNLLPHCHLLSVCALCRHHLLRAARLQNPRTCFNSIRKTQRALRSNKFNPDLKFQSRLESFNPDRKFQSRSKISIPRCFYLRGPPGVTEKGSIENFNPRSIARIFQSRRPRSNFFDPWALWD